jgi:hypothetical protein
MKGPCCVMVICVRLFIASHVVLGRRSSGMRECHQWSMTKAHEAEHDRKDNAAQCGSGSVRAHESYLAMAR